MGFGNEGGECYGECGHLVNVGFNDGPKRGEEVRVRPLVWGTEIIVKG